MMMVVVQVSNKVFFRSLFVLLVLTSFPSLFDDDGDDTNAFAHAMAVFDQSPKLSQHPNLQNFVQAQTNTLLSLKLDIHQTIGDFEAHIPIDNLQLELHCQQPIAPSTHAAIPMPGMDGPLPELSSGVFGMGIQQPGCFITMEGMQHLDISHAAWEMCWAPVPSGSVIVCLTLGRDTQRGDITIPRDTSLYMSFPVFTRDGLQELQDDKARLLDKAQGYVQQRKEAIQKIKSELNPIKKAMLYREAANAAELYSLVDFGRLQKIPSPDEVLKIDGDLLISKKGEIWKRQDETSQQKGQRIGMGTATIVKTHAQGQRETINTKLAP